MSEKKYKIPSPSGFPRIESGKKKQPEFPRIKTNPQTIEIDSEWIIEEQDLDEYEEEA